VVRDSAGVLVDFWSRCSAGSGNR